MKQGGGGVGGGTRNETKWEGANLITLIYLSICLFVKFCIIKLVLNEQ